MNGWLNEMETTPATTQRMFRLAIHGIAAFEIGALLFYMSRYDPGVTSGSGGQEIGLFFDLLMLAALLPAELAFCLFKRQEVRVVAALVILAPLVVAGYVALGSVTSPIGIAMVVGLGWWGLSRFRGIRR